MVKPRMKTFKKSKQLLHWSRYVYATFFNILVADEMGGKSMHHRIKRSVNGLTLGTAATCIGGMPYG